MLTAPTADALTADFQWRVPENVEYYLLRISQRLGEYHLIGITVNPRALLNGGLTLIDSFAVQVSPANDIWMSVYFQM